MNGRTVLLCGRSLLLSGVTASLEQCAGLRTVQAATCHEAVRLMSEQPPDVLIFDLTGGCEGQILSLLLANPTLLMIGLDPECNRAVLVSGHEAQSPTLDQIAEIAQRGDAALREQNPSIAQPSAD
jgi:DNA-binding NarL/FixJ family response regulator